GGPNARRDATRLGYFGEAVQRAVRPAHLVRGFGVDRLSFPFGAFAAARFFLHSILDTGGRLTVVLADRLLDVPVPAGASHEHAGGSRQNKGEKDREPDCVHGGAWEK